VKILFIASFYYPSIGEVEYVVKSVAERLAKRGHEVTVIAGEPGAERPMEEEEAYKTRTALGIYQ